METTKADASRIWLSAVFSCFAFLFKETGFCCFWCVMIVCLKKKKKKKKKISVWWLTWNLLCVMKAQQEERQRNYLHLLATEEQNLIPNTDETDCPICFSHLQPGEGIVLRECLHTFCRSDAIHDPVAQWFAYSDCFLKVYSATCHDQQSVQRSTLNAFIHLGFVYVCVFLFRECLKGTVVNSQDAEVSCPDNCESKLLDREIKEVSVRPKNKKLTRV